MTCFIFSFFFSENFLTDCFHKNVFYIFFHKNVFKDVYEFLNEIDEQDSRRKSEPIKPVSGPSGGTCINPLIETRKNDDEVKERRKEWEEERARNMETLTKYKSEIARLELIIK